MAATVASAESWTTSIGKARWRALAASWLGWQDSPDNTGITDSANLAERLISAKRFEYLTATDTAD